MSNNSHSLTVALEYKASQYIVGYSSKSNETIFYAGYAECGYLVENMIHVLRSASGFKDNSKIDDFIKKYSQYIGIKNFDLGDEMVNEIYTAYKTILDEIENNVDPD